MTNNTYYNDNNQAAHAAYMRVTGINGTMANNSERKL